VANEIRLLSLKEMQALFPYATLQLEYIGPLLKSITAVEASGSEDRKSPENEERPRVA
jgi:hypothetical protein